MYLTQLRIERKAGVSLSIFLQYDKCHRETTEGENKSHVTVPLFVWFWRKRTIDMRTNRESYKTAPLTDGIGAIQYITR